MERVRVVGNCVAGAVAGNNRVAAVVVVNVRRVGAEDDFSVEILINNVAEECVTGGVSVGRAGAGFKFERAEKSAVVGCERLDSAGIAAGVVVVALNQISNAFGEELRHVAFHEPRFEHRGVNKFVGNDTVKIILRVFLFNAGIRVAVLVVQIHAREVIEVDTDFDFVVGRGVGEIAGGVAVGIVGSYSGKLSGICVEKVLHVGIVEVEPVAFVGEPDAFSEPPGIDTFGNRFNEREHVGVI